MTRTPEPGKTPKKPEKPDERSARLAAALRANLARRKAQARGRGGPKAAPGKDEGGSVG